jgi:3-deoxy-manno-octulosonate cytidylyltransferase (CMP-KDO synthetase)
MNFMCVIPARYSSKRFPGKPIASINGSPMIEWVYNRALAANIFDDIIVATDDQRIYDVVKSFDAKVVMTSSDFVCGTDRVAEVAQTNHADVYINLQVDEPLISPQLLKDLCQPFKENQVLVTTAIKRISSSYELNNPNFVKVVIDNKNDAIYFSRSIVPFYRDADNNNSWCQLHIYYKHIGIYAYRRDFLLLISKLPQGNLEKAEKLEQLRILENGYKIRTIITDYDSMGVDTREDLHAVEEYIRLNKIKMDSCNEKV